MEKAALPVNNEFYDELGDRWYAAHDDPVALLRAESRTRNPWVAQVIRERIGAGARVLDVGCGAGFLSNYLAQQGCAVTGIDASAESLAVASRHDASRRVRYDQGDALSLPYPDAAFDVVCAMDFLEHVEQPARVIEEAARVLRAGGLFFFHTFNRNPLAWLIVIKGVEWFVRNTPKHMHVLRLFLKPAEVREMCSRSALEVTELRGMRPVLGAAFWRMLATRVVPDDFQFEFTRATLMAYTGYAERRSRNDDH